jgi:NAD(P)-dependent dehydrogenase (short-subunit alcohol dehydrogenase family)
MGRVAGKVALVTGGACGIGRATCQLLAREGAKIVVADIREDACAELAAQLRESGAAASWYKLDVGEEHEWQAAIQHTLLEFGALDILVNNAGVGFPNGDVEKQTFAEWREVMRVNADGAFLGIKYAIAAMRRHDRGGSIINVSSILGLVGSPTTCAYTASKGTVRLLTKSAALHCAKAGYRIRVNSIHPGWIETPMSAEALARRGDAAAARKQMESTTPLGHFGRPEDIGHGILYLASDESEFVTGAELVIDGGYTAQ